MPPQQLEQLDPRTMPRQPTVDELPLEGVWQNFSHFFAAGGLAPMGYPQNIRRLFHPRDNDHGAVVALCGAARLSVTAALRNWDDDDAVEEMFSAAEAADDVALIVKKNADMTTIGFDQAIVIDGLISILRQPYVTLLILDPVFAAETRAQIDGLAD